MVMTMNPSEYVAAEAVSVKVFMPLLKNKLLMLFCKFFCLGEFLYLHAHGLTQLNLILDVEDSLPRPATNMHVNGPVVIAVEKEPIAIFDKYRRHTLSLRATVVI